MEQSDRPSKEKAVKETLTLGVIGHVDHGKTAFVRRLTGIETDRLREERDRGLSIVLGFSWFETNGGYIDLIDAPGHEDFIRAMISGATGLDGVVLVVAANEGIKPQTREHFDIARLLDLKTGVIVISKVDLVDGNRLATLRDELTQFVAGSFLEPAPIVAVSAVSGEGIERAGEALGALAASAADRPGCRGFFLPLDRVFAASGFGVVGTGTLRGTPLEIDCPVEILPSGARATVRGLQIHGKPVSQALPGQRVAVNLRGAKFSDLSRGDTIATPGLLRPTRRIDAELAVLADASRPLKNGSVFRLLTGTSQRIARLRLIDQDEIRPGEKALVQLRLDREIATHDIERFLLRNLSPAETVGGGRVIDANAKRHRRFDSAVTHRLATRAGGDLAAIVEERLEAAAFNAVSLNDLQQENSIDPAQLEETLQALAVVRLRGGKLMAHAQANRLVGRVVNELEQFHQAHSQSAGASIARITATFTETPDPDALHWAIDEAVRTGEAAREGSLLRLSSFDPLHGLADVERKILTAIEAKYLACGIESPDSALVAGGSQRKQELHNLLIELGKLVRLRTYDRETSIILHEKAIDLARQKLVERFPYPAQFAVKEVRDALGSTRRHVVPLMEHFDATGITIRNGDLRQIRRH